uniref:Uncharacterized protein TCIL3000_11_10910 n=1 Tax=Trypanosoma congolense (strain IL3000) TaxID=1068625 RepID=G0V1U3_TRYCI|nr:unnamed protein product [Trypanosoma congolense IL3000]
MVVSRGISDALAMQFQWVQVFLLGRRKHYTVGARRRAALFVFMHLCLVIVFFAYFLHDIVSASVAVLIQTTAFVISIMHASAIMDYSDRIINAMELEQQLNPLVVAGLTVRCFTLLHYSLLSWWLMFVVGVLELLYNYWLYRRGLLLVDATTAWRQLEALRTDGKVRVAFQIVLLLIAFTELLYVLIID